MFWPFYHTDWCPTSGCCHTGPLLQWSYWFYDILVTLFCRAGFHTVLQSLSSLNPRQCFRILHHWVVWFFEEHKTFHNREKQRTAKIFNIVGILKPHYLWEIPEAFESQDDYLEISNTYFLTFNLWVIYIRTIIQEGSFLYSFPLMLKQYVIIFSTSNLVIHDLSSVF